MRVIEGVNIFPYDLSSVIDAKRARMLCSRNVKCFHTARFRKYEAPVDSILGIGPDVPNFIRCVGIVDAVSVASGSAWDNNACGVCNVRSRQIKSAEFTRSLL